MRLPAKLRWAIVAAQRAAGDIEGAEALLDAIEAEGGEGICLLEERARLAFAAGRHETALSLLKERIARAPSATAWIALARFHLEHDDLEAARAISSDLSQTHPTLTTVTALAVDIAYAGGDPTAKRIHHQRLLADRQDHVPSLLALARLALDDGDSPQAAEYLDRALAASDEMMSAAQLGLAAGIAVNLDDADLASSLYDRQNRAEAARVAALLAQARAALGDEAEADDHVVIQAGTAPWPPASPGSDGRQAGESIDVDPAERELVTFSEDPDLDQIHPGALDALRHLFGHAALRRGQAAVIANVLSGKDTLATMPTGAGKSLTFQLPAMLLDGVTLVISPLIALMKDQVESLPPAVRDRTVLINSTLTPEEQRRRLDELATGAYKLVYVAPERLRHHAFLRALRSAGVSLVVIDEAHCISLWGHDFRPDYLTIPKSLPELGEPPVLAITATATPAMARAIAGGLGRELDRVRISLFRPNLFYEAHRLANREEKVAKVLDICRSERGAGIVYVSSRKDAEAIAGVLRDRGVSAIPYHAGLDPAIRARNQERFMAGQVRVVVATVAFGMGVDKADVRFIVHLSPPKSLEAYAQESGRAGRDGKPARCVLLVSPTDQASLNRLARRDELDIGILRRVYAGLARAASGRWAVVDPANLLPPADFDDQEDMADPRVALGILEEAGLLRRHPDAPIARFLRQALRASTQPETSDGDPTWQRLRAYAGLDGLEHGTATIHTADACNSLGFTPSELDRLLGTQPDVIVRDERRAVCLEILPAGSDAPSQLTRVLERSRADAQRRIKQVMGYAAGNRCRHALLAAHLGEALDACRTACDVCTGSAVTRVPGVGARQPGKDERRSRRGEEWLHRPENDAFAVLEAVRSLPFPMGKTGLAKLLVGSVESRVRADRSASFGVLAHLSRSKVESLIDRLVADDYLFRDMDHEFKLIRLTERRGNARVEDLAAYQTLAKPIHRAGVGSASAGEPTEETLDAAAEALLQRLHAWRRNRASADAVPPYVVAHNNMLLAVAQSRPLSHVALGNLPGFGPARVEKYGDEILALTSEA
ncbi:MAG: RecQ family ATP-dependent DNA helicase [Chloroflexota bacterium]|nr:RecQ family ATP-dependent DNA helicase [Chloroflexota bacterium]